MSALPVRAITDPAGIVLPPLYDTLHQYLTRPEREQLLQELLAAIPVAQADDNLSPVQKVLSSWAYTAVLRADPNFEANLDAAGGADRGRPHSRDDLDKRFSAG